MSSPPPLMPAQPGDGIDAAALVPLRQLLNDQIGALNQALQQAGTQQEMNDIAAVQARLAVQAQALTVARIEWLTGEARITADHIGSAVDAAQAVIDQVASLKTRLAQLGALIDFAAALLSGNGKAVVQSAQALKTALAQPA